MLFPCMKWMPNLKCFVSFVPQLHLKRGALSSWLPYNRVSIKNLLVAQKAKLHVPYLAIGINSKFEYDFWNLELYVLYHGLACPSIYFCFFCFRDGKSRWGILSLISLKLKMAHNFPLAKHKL